MPVINGFSGGTRDILAAPCHDHESGIPNPGALSNPLKSPSLRILLLGDKTQRDKIPPLTKICLLLNTGAWWSGQFCKMGQDVHRCAFGRWNHYETDIDRQPQCVLRKIEPRLASIVFPWSLFAHIDDRGIE